MNTRKIPTIFVIVLLVAGLTAGVFLVRRQQTFKLSASTNSNPHDIRITNITDVSFTVSWYTDKNSQGFLSWGETVGLGETAFSDENDIERVHYIDVENLRANTNYFFNINSGGDVHDNGGVPWKVKTGARLGAAQTTYFSSGKVLSEYNTPASGVIVYLQIGGAGLVSAQTSQNGSWLIPLSSIRTQDNNNYFQGLSGDTILNILVQGGPLGQSSTSLTVNETSPTPTMVLKESASFNSNIEGEEYSLPGSTLNLPVDDGGSSF